MTAVHDHREGHARRKLIDQRRDLVVDEHPSRLEVHRADRLVPARGVAPGFVAVDIRHLGAVPGVLPDDHVAGSSRADETLERGADVRVGRVAVEHQVGFEAEPAQRLRPEPGIPDAAGQRARRVTIDADAQRTSPASSGRRADHSRGGYRSRRRRWRGRGRRGLPPASAERRGEERAAEVLDLRHRPRIAGERTSLTLGIRPVELGLGLEAENPERDAVHGRRVVVEAAVRRRPRGVRPVGRERRREIASAPWAGAPARPNSRTRSRSRRRHSSRPRISASSSFSSASRIR